MLCIAAVLGHAGEVRAQAGAARLTDARQEVLINLAGGLPARWVACAAACTEGRDTHRMVFLRVTPGGGQLAWSVPDDPVAEARLAELAYTASSLETPAGRSVVLTSRDAFQGVQLVHSYRLAPDGTGLVMSLQIPAGAGLRLTGGDDLVPERLPGLGGWYSQSRPVVVTADGPAEPGTGQDAESPPAALGAGDWAGVRSRFWALLLQPDAPLSVAAVTGEAGRPGLRLGDPAPVGRIVDFRVYAGPVERDALNAVAPELTGLLFASLWNWLRALSFGLLTILQFWQGLVGNWGLAIILLSVSVKLLMWPLTWVAERWQADVNRIQSRLQPELAAIKAGYRGEEAHERTLAVYRQHGVSPFYTLKSLAGFLIQIPIFIAAFDMLGENFGLAGASFLWIRDLALPDRLAALPGAIPYFGGHLNLLPFVMTAFTVLAARLQEDPSLAPALRGGQRLRLYGMAALFFVLLYTFPAGMVLYWTTNNVLHLLRLLPERLRASLSPQRPGEEPRP